MLALPQGFCACLAAFVALAARAQPLVGVDASVVAITPHRRQPISSDRLQFVERRLLRRKDRAGIYAALHAALACTPGARTIAPQHLIWMLALMPIGPANEELSMLLVHQVGRRHHIIG